jgi:hypothetical protein
MDPCNIDLTSIDYADTAPGTFRAAVRLEKLINQSINPTYLYTYTPSMGI